VTIPEFGAFLTHRISAKIQNETHTFYPPKKVVSFNEQLQNNDGLLANYIADVEKIPYEFAVKKIAKRVHTIKSYLREGETITFDAIGDVSLNTEGSITFEPSTYLNYLTDAFGLSQFNSNAVTREIYKEQIEALEEAIPIAVTPEKRQAKPYLRYAAVALIALTLGGFGMSQFHNNQVQSHNQLAQEEANAELESKIQEATFIIENPLPMVTLNVTKQSGNYHIIDGAFRNEENAFRKIDQLKDNGYHARTIGENKYGLHQVVYASYDDRVEALQALRDVKANHNRDAWLLVKKLD
jgi:hypothetical protein